MTSIGIDIRSRTRPRYTEPLQHAGLVTWLDASYGVVTSGGVVDSWEDRSPAAHNWTASAGTRPSLVTSGFGTQSSPYVLHDGTDDFLTTPDHADFKPQTATFVIFAALRFVSGTAAFRCVVGKGSDTAASGWRMFRDSTNHLQFYYNGGSPYVASTLTLADGADAALQWGVDSPNAVVLYANGTTRERTAVTVTTTGTGTNAVVTGRDNTPAYNANIRLAELLIYKRATTDPFLDNELAAILGYLKTRPGI